MSQNSTQPNEPSSTGSGASSAPSPRSSAAPRRGFFKRALAGGLGALLSLFPIGAGLFTFADPLASRKKNPGPGGGDEDSPNDVPNGYIQVASINALPENGTPQFFRVISDRTDAWNYFPNEPVGSVFLQKKDDGSVVAFNSTCPHAGCAVDFRRGERDYFCPCHNSNFSITGARSPSSPSPRDLDELNVLVQDGRVWVEYRDFRSGTEEKIEVS